MRAPVILALLLPVFTADGQQRPARDQADPPLRIIRGQVRADDDTAALLRTVKVTVAAAARYPPLRIRRGASRSPSRRPRPLPFD